MGCRSSKQEDKPKHEKTKKVKKRKTKNNPCNAGSSQSLNGVEHTVDHAMSSSPDLNHYAPPEEIWSLSSQHRSSKDIREHRTLPVVKQLTNLPPDPIQPMANHLDMQHQTFEDLGQAVVSLPSRNTQTPYHTRETLDPRQDAPEIATCEDEQLMRRQSGIRLTEPVKQASNQQLVDQQWMQQQALSQQQFHQQENQHRQQFQLQQVCLLLKQLPSDKQLEMLHQLNEQLRHLLQEEEGSVLQQQEQKRQLLQQEQISVLQQLLERKTQLSHLHEQKQQLLQGKLRILQQQQERERQLPLQQEQQWQFIRQQELKSWQQVGLNEQQWQLLQQEYEVLQKQEQQRQLLQQEIEEVLQKQEQQRQLLQQEIEEVLQKQEQQKHLLQQEQLSVSQQIHERQQELERWLKQLKQQLQLPQQEQQRQHLVASRTDLESRHLFASQVLYSRVGATFFSSTQPVSQLASINQMGGRVGINQFGRQVGVQPTEGPVGLIEAERQVVEQRDAFEKQVVGKNQERQQAGANLIQEHAYVNEVGGQTILAAGTGHGSCQTVYKGVTQTGTQQANFNLGVTYQISTAEKNTRVQSTCTQFSTQMARQAGTAYQHQQGVQFGGDETNIGGDSFVLSSARGFEMVEMVSTITGEQQNQMQQQCYAIGFQQAGETSDGVEWTQREGTTDAWMPASSSYQMIGPINPEGSFTLRPEIPRSSDHQINVAGSLVDTPVSPRFGLSLARTSSSNTIADGVSALGDSAVFAPLERQSNSLGAALQSDPVGTQQAQSWIHSAEAARGLLASSGQQLYDVQQNRHVWSSAGQQFGSTPKSIQKDIQDDSYRGGGSRSGGKLNLSHPKMPTGRSYIKGWAPHSSNSDIVFRSTIRDTGRGLAQTSDFVPRRSGEVPSTYEDIKSNCLMSGRLWEDPDFPPVASSIYFKEPPSEWPNIQWKRPSAICANPQLFVDGANRMDVMQGRLGDCWLIAAVASLTINQLLLYNVVPPDQSFDREYAGVFRFQFWQYGRWLEVLIDDRLPTQNNELIYMHSKDRNEFWSALLEKAYAKLNGSYEALSSGQPSEALTDFTGGVVKRFELKSNIPPHLFQIMVKAQNKGSLMACGIGAPEGNMEEQKDNGLSNRHAYSITNVRTFQTSKLCLEIQMVRVRNPWGDSSEWKGAWSDGSWEWQTIPEDEKRDMGLTLEHDGEFWMSFKDFVSNYDLLEICFLGPDSLTEVDEQKGTRKWEGCLFEGSWRRGVNAGGCRKSTFWTNPQYRVKIVDPDSDDEDGHGSIIIGLMQKERRKMRKEGKEDLCIGYAIYEVSPSQAGALEKSFFDRPAAARPEEFSCMREVSSHLKLLPGDYVIVPSTFEPNEEGDFLLRIFSERKNDKAEEIDDVTTTVDVKKDALGRKDPADKTKKEEGRQAFLYFAGADGKIDAFELQNILNAAFKRDFAFDGFSTDMTRSMVAMRDADMTGKLGFEDFKRIWADLTLCKRAFKMMDTGGNGYFDSYEFRNVLNNLGFRVSNATFNAIVMRYSGREGHVKFDDFVSCYIKLKTLFETFQKKDPANEGRAIFKFDEFQMFTMYS